MKTKILIVTMSISLLSLLLIVTAQGKGSCGTASEQPASGILKDATAKSEQDDGMEDPVLTVSAAEVRRVAEGGNHFALDLYARLGREPGNLFFSPFSISTALAMTYAGARGVTASEMEQVLHFPTDVTDLHALYDELLRTTMPPTGPTTAEDVETAGYRLSVANRLWGQRGFQFLTEFIKTMMQNYGAGLETLDFAGASEAARQTINRWVEEQTEDRIKDLIPAGVLTPDVVLVLTNAIYFYGKWAAQFPSERTSPEPFYVAPDRPAEVQMMHVDQEFAYASLDGLDILELPYQGGDLSYLALLPKDLDGLPQVEKELTPEKLTDWLASLAPANVHVSLPKYRLSSWFDLAKVLSDMGMQSAFGQADFSGMTGRKDLFISAVVHKAFVDVQEEGTEAAAATGVIMKKTSVSEPKPWVDFRADHPFLFLIRDNRSGSILFMGRFVDPISS
jgi:serpin B